MARLQALYKEKITQELQTQFAYTNIMAVPRIVKISLNMGVGEAVNNKKVIDAAVADMVAIAGQKPVVTYARKSNAGFGIRKGWPIGCKVSLRRQRMYEFLDRFTNVVIPRIRDFRGLSTRSFDGRGNYSLGIHEQIVFPEVKYEDIDTLRGLDISIITTAKTDKEAHALLVAFGFPFKED